MWCTDEGWRLEESGIVLASMVIPPHSSLDVSYDKTKRQVDLEGCGLLSVQVPYHLWKGGRSHLMECKVAPLLDRVAGRLLCPNGLPMLSMQPCRIPHTNRSAHIISYTRTPFVCAGRRTTDATNQQTTKWLAYYKCLKSDLLSTKCFKSDMLITSQWYFYSFVSGVRSLIVEKLARKWCELGKDGESNTFISLEVQ